MYQYKEDNDANSIRYFEILNEGYNHLLKINHITYKEAKPALNSYSEPTPARYISSVDYYLSINNKRVQKLRSLNKKEILNLIDIEEANNYVKKSSFKFKTEKM